MGYNDLRPDPIPPPFCNCQRPAAGVLARTMEILFLVVLALMFLACVGLTFLIFLSVRRQEILLESIETTVGKGKMVTFTAPISKPSLLTEKELEGARR